MNNNNEIASQKQTYLRLSNIAANALTQRDIDILSALLRLDERVISFTEFTRDETNRYVSRVDMYIADDNEHIRGVRSIGSICAALAESRTERRQRVAASNARTQQYIDMINKQRADTIALFVECMINAKTDLKSLAYYYRIIFSGSRANFESKKLKCAAKCFEDFRKVYKDGEFKFFIDNYDAIQTALC